MQDFSARGGQATNRDGRSAKFDLWEPPSSLSGSAKASNATARERIVIKVLSLETLSLRLASFSSRPAAKWRGRGPENPRKGRWPRHGEKTTLRRRRGNPESSE